MPESAPIYLDYQATTPTDPAVVAKMLPFFTHQFGNAHAVEHCFGRAAAEAVTDARKKVAALLAASPTEIVFTSGATEANNLILKAAASAMGRRGRHRIVSVPTEHKAVSAVLSQLAAQGFEIAWAEVGLDGLVALESLDALIDDQTALVTIMAVNNEIGVIQDLGAIGAICRERGALFHTDAAQACGKIPLDLTRLPIDFMSISAHKFYGPKGIGAAYVRQGLHRGLEAQMVGGGQERGLRAGTLPTPLCVGFGEACAIARDMMHAERKHLLHLRDSFLELLREGPVSFALNGALEPRWPGNLNISFAGVDAEALVMGVGDRLALSSGSACTADSLEPSHVLTALGLDADRAASAIRIGFGRSTTQDEVNRAAGILVSVASSLAAVSWSGERKTEGVHDHAAQ